MGNPTDRAPGHPGVRATTFHSGQEVTAAELEAAGLLEVAPGCEISRTALFIPVDRTGVARAVRIGAGVRVGAFSIVYGGVELADEVTVESAVLVGKPEEGYAVGRVYPGSGAVTTVASGTVIRSGAVVYAGVEIGADSAVGHHSLLRSHVKVGEGTLLGHNLTIERETRIGASVRCSPGSHITSATVLADRVFHGAGIRTINDKTLTWRQPDAEPDLVPPRFETGARVGSGCTVLGGVTVGAEALVGAHSLVTRDVPADTVAFGVPAQIRGAR